MHNHLRKWNFEVQLDHLISARRPYLVNKKKQKKTKTKTKKQNKTKQNKKKQQKKQKTKKQKKQEQKKKKKEKEKEKLPNSRLCHSGRRQGKTERKRKER